MTTTPRPIVLLGAPRSRTSLTAHIFHAHGVWVGRYKDGDENNPKGYYENRDFKKSLIDLAGRDCVHKGFVCKPRVAWPGVCEDVLKRTGYEGGPWLVKHSVMYWPMWSSMNPFMVSIRRDPRAIKESCLSTGYLKDEQAIKAHIAALDDIEENHGAYRLDTDRYFSGDWAQMDAVFSAAGLKFDKDIAERIVDGKFNRFGG